MDWKAFGSEGIQEIKKILVSLDREDFIDKLRDNKYGVEAYHVTECPYREVSKPSDNEHSEIFTLG